MSYDNTQLGVTRIHYRIDDLFHSLQKWSPLHLFTQKLDAPLGDTDIVLVSNGGRFDVMTCFSGADIIEPITLLEDFVRPFGRISKIDQRYHAYLFSTSVRDYVVSYEPTRSEFLFSTSIAFVGVDARAYMLESPIFTAVVFRKIFIEYMELLREFIDVVYLLHNVHSDGQVIGLRASSDEVMSRDLGTPILFDEPTSSKDGQMGKVLQFVRPKK